MGVKDKVRAFRTAPRNFTLFYLPQKNWKGFTQDNTISHKHAFKLVRQKSYFIRHVSK